MSQLKIGNGIAIMLSSGVLCAFAGQVLQQTWQGEKRATKIKDSTHKAKTNGNRSKKPERKVLKPKLFGKKEGTRE